MKSLSLDGTWMLRGSDEQRWRVAHANKEHVDETKWVEGRVPGEVHWDLLRAGVISDPNVGVNVLNCRWVEEYLWAYRKEVEVPAEAAGGRSWLVLDGVDLVAKVFVNGELVGVHKNMFYPCRVEVTGKLRAGKNLIVVIVDSGLWETADKAGAGLWMTPDQALHKRQWMRKTQSQFSWDWSPRMVNVGIFGHARLEWAEGGEAVRVEELVPLVTLAEDLQSAKVVGRLWVEGLGKETLKGKLRVEVVEAGVRGEVEVDVKPGINAVEATLAVAEPKLWWPIGHGEQPLYTVRAELEVGGRKVEARKTIGFRHVKINQEALAAKDGGGRRFVLEVNGRPIFCKGGNFVPADLITARLDAARYETLVDRAIEANFNFLRVWGGGLYESEAFYELCDRRGILVWQEFIYACSRYPMTDQTFFEDAKREAVYQIRRLANHPSLVIWCGNNEMEWGNWDWGFDKGVVHPDYAFFHLTLPRLLAAEDGTRYYQPSSPWSGPAVRPTLHEIGDQHPWELGFWDTDYRKYRGFVSRFPNEGGILGPTSLPTMLACLEGNGKGGDPKQKSVGSWAWQIHENSVDAWTEPSHTAVMMPFHLGRNEQDMTIEEFTYWAGLVQGEGLAEYIKNFRRRMFTSAAAIFWMYNDVWPAVRSWTVVDYYLRRTPAFWAVKRAMAPVTVVVAEENGEVVVFGVNETRETVKGSLRYGVMHLGGGMMVDRTATVELPANASTRLAAFPRQAWSQEETTAAFAMLTQGERLVARDRLMTGLIKEMRLARRPRVEVVRRGEETVFKSDVFVLGVCVDLDGEEQLGDNFFDVWPGVEYAVRGLGERGVLRVGNGGGRE